MFLFFSFSLILLGNFDNLYLRLPLLLLLQYFNEYIKIFQLLYFKGKSYRFKIVNIVKENNRLNGNEFTLKPYNFCEEFYKKITYNVQNFKNNLLFLDSFFFFFFFLPFPMLFSWPYKDFKQIINGANMFEKVNFIKC